MSQDSDHYERIADSVSTPDPPPGARHKVVVVVSGSHLREIQDHARETYPAECCGILVGRRRDEPIWVTAVHPAVNRRAHAAHDRYEIDSQEILRIDHAAADRGEEVVGFYHSHPDHPALPSPTDATQAWPAYIYLIAAVAAHEDGEVTAWTYDDQRQRFIEQPLRVRTQAPGAGAPSLQQNIIPSAATRAS